MVSNSSPMMEMGSSPSVVPYIGSQISLITISEIRYEGILYSINTEDATIALQTVRSFGTEHRVVEREIPPSVEIYDFITFRGSDIKDLTVQGYQDPAIVSKGGGSRRQISPLDPKQSYNEFIPGAQEFVPSSFYRGGPAVTAAVAGVGVPVTVGTTIPAGAVSVGIGTMPGHHNMGAIRCRGPIPMDGRPIIGGTLGSGSGLTTMGSGSNTMGSGSNTMNTLGHTLTYPAGAQKMFQKNYEKPKKYYSNYNSRKASASISSSVGTINNSSTKVGSFKGGDKSVGYFKGSSMKNYSKGVDSYSKNTGLNKATKNSTKGEKRSYATTSHYGEEYKKGSHSNTTDSNTTTNNSEKGTSGNNGEEKGSTTGKGLKGTVYQKGRFFKGGFQKGLQKGLQSHYYNHRGYYSNNINNHGIQGMNRNVSAKSYGGILVPDGKKLEFDGDFEFKSIEDSPELIKEEEEKADKEKAEKEKIASKSDQKKDAEEKAEKPSEEKKTDAKDEKAAKKEDKTMDQKQTDTEKADAKSPSKKEPESPSKKEPKSPSKKDAKNHRKKKDVTSPKKKTDTEAKKKPETDDKKKESKEAKKESKETKKESIADEKNQVSLDACEAGSSAEGAVAEKKYDAKKSFFDNITYYRDDMKVKAGEHKKNWETFFSLQ